MLIINFGTNILRLFLKFGSYHNINAGLNLIELSANLLMLFVIELLMKLQCLFINYYF